MEKAKQAKDTVTEQAYVIMHRHINGCGRLFGGQLMQWIDEAAGIISKRYSQAETITAAVDNLDFKEGAYLNDIIVLTGKVTYVGNSSVEVRVDTYVEDLDGTRKIINRAYAVMVAVDGAGHPVRVPRLVTETREEQEEWEQGQKRYELRNSTARRSISPLESV